MTTFCIGRRRGLWTVSALTKIGLATGAILGLFVFTPPLVAQHLNNATRNQITSEYLAADNSYAARQYGQAWEQLQRIRKLNPGLPIPTAQDLRVKVLIAQGRWDEAKLELRILEGLDLTQSQEILRAIAVYNSEVSKGSFTSVVRAYEACNRAVANEHRELSVWEKVPWTSDIKQVSRRKLSKKHKQEFSQYFEASETCHTALTAKMREVDERLFTFENDLQEKERYVTNQLLSDEISPREFVAMLMEIVEQTRRDRSSLTEDVFGVRIPYE